MPGKPHNGGNLSKFQLKIKAIFTQLALLCIFTLCRHLHGNNEGIVLDDGVNGVNLATVAKLSL